MDETLLKAIEVIESQLKPIEEQANHKKKLINGLCEAAGEPPRYPNVESTGSTSSFQAIREDQFFGQPLATSARWILERRKNSGLSAISLSELFETLKNGGYAFDNKDEAIAKRNAAITLSKNPTFMKVPGSGNIGLAEWYPTAKRAKPKSAQELVSEYVDETLEELAERPDEEEHPFGNEKPEGATGG